MEDVKKIEINGEVWRSWLNVPKISETFKIDTITQASIARGLAEAYFSEVRSRNGTFSKDERASNMCNKIAEVLTAEHTTKFGIMLAGTNGNGKTTMAKAFQKVINTVCDYGSGKYVDKMFSGCSFMTAKEILKNANSSLYKKFAEDGVVVIDDFGEESTEIVNYGNIETPITNLIEERYTERRFTFFTTNLTAEQIKEKYGLRIYDRLKEMVCLIVVGDGSYRGKK